MADLSIRKLNDNAYDLLQKRAVKHRVSMEEEARQIIYRAVAAPERISTIFKNYFGKKNGITLKIPHLRKPHEPMDFNE